MKQISKWWWHTVYLQRYYDTISENDNSYVKKIPVFYNTTTYDHLSYLLEYWKDKFWDYILDTTLFPAWKNSYYMRQAFLEWEHLKKSDLALSEIKEQINEILSIHSSCMKKDWIWVEFVWKEWTIECWKSLITKSVEPEISNVIIDTKKQLRIIDPSLIDLSSRWWYMRQFWSYISELNNKIYLWQFMNLKY